MSGKFAELKVRGALKAAGLPAEGDLQRASSVHNEVWLSEHHVIRISRGHSLRRERTIATLVSAAVGYPDVVTMTKIGGADAMIQRRLPGRPLAHAWPWLDDDQRAAAVGQLCSRLRALHETPLPTGGVEHVQGPQLVSADATTTVARIGERLDRVSRLPGMDAGLVLDIRMQLDRCADSIDNGAKVLTHGDLTFENVLWDGRRVTALLDLEYADVRNADVDLDVMLRMAAFPSAHVGDDFAAHTRVEDYAQMPTWLRQHYVDLFKSPRQRDRMRVYAMGFDLNELSHYDGVGPYDSLPEIHPVRRLQRLVDENSYVDRWIRSNERQRLG